MNGIDEINGTCSAKSYQDQRHESLRLKMMLNVEGSHRKKLVSRAREDPAACLRRYLRLESRYGLCKIPNY